MIVSAHPRTINSLKKFNFIKKSKDLVNWHSPFGLIDYIKLQKESYCVISDSGTIHEDSAILKFPAIAIRKSTEKYESLESGHCPITGLDSINVLNMIEVVIKNSPSLINSPIPDPYNQINVSNKVTNIILGMRDIVDFSAWEGKTINYYDKFKKYGYSIKKSKNL